MGFFCTERSDVVTDSFSHLVELRGKTVLLTGAAGFIGSRILEILNDHRVSTFALDGLLDTTYSSKIKRDRWDRMKSEFCDSIKFVEIDLRDRQEVLDLPKVDIVFNLAAMPGLEKSWTDFEKYLSCNVNSVHNLIDYMKLKSVPHIVQASTSSVYGKYALGNEESELKPSSPYGITKLCAENLIRAHSDIFGFTYSILRYFSVFGPNQRPDMAFFIFTDRMLKGLPLTIFGDGTQSRSNTFVDDIAYTTLVSGVDSRFKNEIFNVCGDHESSVLDSIRLIAGALELSPIIINAEERIGDQLRTKGDNSKLGAFFDTSKFKTTFEMLPSCVQQMRQAIAIGDV